jgi:hypothetical protein
MMRKSLKKKVTTVNRLNNTTLKLKEYKVCLQTNIKDKAMQQKTKMRKKK